MREEEPWSITITLWGLNKEEIQLLKHSAGLGLHAMRTIRTGLDWDTLKPYTEFTLTENDLSFDFSEVKLEKERLASGFYRTRAVGVYKILWSGVDITQYIPSYVVSPYYVKHLEHIQKRL